LPNFKIKEPTQKNINSIVGAYNARRGHGIELFYNMKKGKLFIADYYKNFNRDGYRKISLVSGDMHLSSVTAEYLAQQVQIIKQEEVASRIAHDKHEKEELARFRAQRRAYYRSKFRLSR
jgi:hypothetical protein